MRLTVSAFPTKLRVLFARCGVVALLCLFAATWRSPQVSAQDEPGTASRVQRMRQSDQWDQIKEHLPDPATASPQALETQGDILRARRFPEDAMDYYRYAMTRGANVAAMTNKLGLCELEMNNFQLARIYFLRATKMNKKNADAWNNLGATEFVDGRQASAVGDYKKAVKLNRRKAVFHANLASAYFESKDYRGARREIAAALELDQHVFDEQGIGGVAAHVLTSKDVAQFSFEMAKIYARSGLTDQMLHALAKAAEAGMDVQIEMRHDPVLAHFEMDPRVVVLVHNAAVLRASKPATVRAEPQSQLN